MYLDGTTQLDITLIRKRGQLKEGTRTFKVTWTNDSSLGVEADMSSDNNGRLRFYYKQNGESVSYWVSVKSRPSNLGKGDLVFFVCPFSYKLCRKLYLQSGYFMHREHGDLIYDSQGRSKSYTAISKIMDRFCVDDVLDDIHSKHFKTHYNGKLTKRCIKLMSRLYNHSELEQQKKLNEVFSDSF